MSNRVSPSPISSPLPPVDDPISVPDELQPKSMSREPTVDTIPMESPIPPPPLPPLDDNKDDNEDNTRDNAEYVPDLDASNSNVEENGIDPPNYNLPDDTIEQSSNTTNTKNNNNDDMINFDAAFDNPAGVDEDKATNGRRYSGGGITSTFIPTTAVASSSLILSDSASSVPQSVTRSGKGVVTEEEEDEIEEMSGVTRESSRHPPTVGRLPPIYGSPQTQRPGWDYRDSPSGHRQLDQFDAPDTLQLRRMSSRPNLGAGITRKGNEDSNIVIGANESRAESGCCAIVLTILSYIVVIIFLPFSLCLTIKVVQEYERAVIFRLGRLLPGGAKGPGIFFVMPCIEEYTKVDLRTVSFDVPPQEVLTRDSVTVSVDAVVYYRISNPTVSVANVENAANSTQLLAQTTLRNVLGTQNLAEILSNREHISEQMQTVLDGATDKWGIKVERVEIKDVRLPTQLQRAMATEAEAARDARAKVIAAEGEQKASVALKEAADIIADSPAAMQLRYLQTLNSISAEKNSTIIFPLPIELISSLVK